MPDLLVALADRRLLRLFPASTLPAGSSHSQRLTAWRYCRIRMTCRGSGIGSSTTDRGWRTRSIVTSRPFGSRTLIALDAEHLALEDRSVRGLWFGH